MTNNRALIVYEECVAEGLKPSGEGSGKDGSMRPGESAVAEAAKRYAKEAKIDVNTARNRIQRAIGSRGAGVVVVDSDNQPEPEDVKGPGYRTRLMQAERQLRETQTQLAHAQQIREHAFKLTPELVKPAGYRYVPSSPSGMKETPVLFTSDFQVGEVIREEDTRGYNAYNVDIFRKRYRRLIEATVGIIERHHGGTDHVVYLRGGDSISGSIHLELADTDEVPPPVQCIILLEEETAGIKALAEKFGKVTVISIPGNHDRIGIKPRAKTYSDHSYERLIQYALEAQFANDPRVEFITDQSGDVLFELHGRKFLLTHGDRIGTGGGDGFAGPTLPIMRGAKKVMAQYAAEGFILDYVLGGHYHTPVDADGVLFNGCLPGYSEYARARMRVRPSPPSQTLFFVHEKYGVTAVRRIYVNGRHGSDQDAPGSRSPVNVTKRKTRRRKTALRPAKHPLK
jgi:hypothetical protein